jgi:hypothetical protein
MRSLEFQHPSIKDLALWVVCCLLPLVVVVVATIDVWIAPRAVLHGVLVAKSFEAKSIGDGSMFFELRGQPYRFSAPIRIVRPASGPRPEEAAYDAVKEGRAADVTVFARDPVTNANRNPTAAITLPVIRVEQNGQVVFDSGILLVAWLLTPVMIGFALIGLLGITVNCRKSP